MEHMRNVLSGLDMNEEAGLREASKRMLASLLAPLEPHGLPAEILALAHCEPQGYDKALRAVQQVAKEDPERGSAFLAVVIHVYHMMTMARADGNRNRASLCGIILRDIAVAVATARVPHKEMLQLRLFASSNTLLVKVINDGIGTVPNSAAFTDMEALDVYGTSMDFLSRGQVAFQHSFHAANACFMHAFRGDKASCSFLNGVYQEMSHGRAAVRIMMLHAKLMRCLSLRANDMFIDWVPLEEQKRITRALDEEEYADKTAGPDHISARAILMADKLRGTPQTVVKGISRKTIKEAIADPNITPWEHAAIGGVVAKYVPGFAEAVDIDKLARSVLRDINTTFPNSLVGIQQVVCSSYAWTTALLNAGIMDSLSRVSLRSASADRFLDAFKVVSGLCMPERYLDGCSDPAMGGHDIVSAVSDRRLKVAQILAQRPTTMEFFHRLMVVIPYDCGRVFRDVLVRATAMVTDGTISRRAAATTTAATTTAATTTAATTTAATTTAATTSASGAASGAGPSEGSAELGAEAMSALQAFRQEQAQELERMRRAQEDLNREIMAAEAKHLERRRAAEREAAQHVKEQKATAKWKKGGKQQ